jgi:hypothetical protein
MLTTLEGRRESNPETDCQPTLQNKIFRAIENALAADWQRLKRHSDNGDFSYTDAISSLSAVVAAWPQLSSAPHQIIVALVQATVK